MRIHRSTYTGASTATGHQQPAGAGSDPGLSVLLPVLLFQQVLASLTFPVAKYGLTEMEPFTYAFFRYVISSVILFLIARMRKHQRPVERADLLKFVGLGLLIIFLNQTAYLYGQALTAAGHGALLFATVPVWIFVLAMIHLKEKLRWRRVAGLIIALAGVVIVMASGAITIGTEYLLGDLIILVAAITWAYYTVLGKPLVRKYGAFRATAYALVSGSVAYFPFGLYRAVQFDLTGVSLGGWLSVAYIAICTSVIAYVVWYWLLNRMEASRLAIYQNLQPVIAAVVAYHFLAEPLGWSFVLGGAITLAGVIISEL